MKYTVALATVAIAAATNVNGDAPKPLVNITYLMGLYTEIAQNFNIELGLETVVAADNAAKGFHNTIEITGGSKKFVSNFDDIMTIYYEEALATLTTGDVATEKMLNTSAMIKEAVRLGVDVLSNDYFNFLHDDVITPWTQAIRDAALPFNNSVAAISNLLDISDSIYIKNKDKTGRRLRSSEELVAADRNKTYEYASIAAVKADICSTEPYLLEIVEIGRKAMNETKVPVIEYFNKRAKIFTSVAPKLIAPLIDFLENYKTMIQKGNILDMMDTVEMAAGLLDSVCNGGDSLQQVVAAGGFNISALVETAVTMYNSTIYMANATLAQVPIFQEDDRLMLGLALRSMFPETAGPRIPVNPNIENQRFITQYVALAKQVVVLRGIVKPFLDSEQQFIADITSFGNNVEAIMKLMLGQ